MVPIFSQLTLGLKHTLPLCPTTDTLFFPRMNSYKNADLLSQRYQAKKNININLLSDMELRTKIFKENTYNILQMPNGAMATNEVFLLSLDFLGRYFVK